MAVVVRSRRLVNPSIRKTKFSVKTLRTLGKRLVRRKATASKAARVARRLVNPSIRRTKAKYKKFVGRPKLKSFSVAGKKLLGMTKASKKNPTTKKRKLSPKQVAIFGTPRQKAALRASKTRKRNAGKGLTFSQKVNKVTAQILKKKPKRKKNIGEIVSISLAGLNPAKKRNSGMAKRRKARNAGTAFGRSWSTYKPRATKGRKKNSGTARRKTSVSKRRRNPIYKIRKVTHRRNPGVLTGAIGKALGVIGGAVATRYATQALLGGRNVGIMGYLGNAISAFALGWGTGRFVNKEMGTNVMIGGFVSTLLRIITDQTDLGKYINLSLQGAGKGGDIGMGIIQDSSFPLPQVNMPGSQANFMVPRATRNFVSSQIDAVRAATTKAPGMGNTFGGQQRRRVM